jgi:hypothetical protein
VLDAAGSQIEWVVVKGSGGDTAVEVTPAYSLTAVLTPTPRWPDAMCIIDPLSKVVFTSKLFSAHVAPGLLNSKVGARAAACALGASCGGAMLVAVHSPLHTSLRCLAPPPSSQPHTAHTHTHTHTHTGQDERV